NIIGSGIFISPKGVLEHCGSVGLALFVWVLGGGITALGSLCYAELGVAIPKSGGDYAYVTEIFGGLAGFLLLWSAVLIMYPTSLAVISMTFSNYVLQPVFPNCIPPAAASRALSMACLSECPPNAFDFWMTPSVGHLALAFLQGSFAFSGWNFLNYVTEELVDPRKNRKQEGGGLDEGKNCPVGLLEPRAANTYTLINYVSFINYLCYGVTILGLLVLRWRWPALHRPIKLRLGAHESMTRWGQELCFVVYPQGSPEEEENGPCQPSPLPAATDKPLKTQ
ncbi:hypothetical protein E2I00_018020, partial [Balaenoptera physalus]